MSPPTDKLEPSPDAIMNAKTEELDNRWYDEDRQYPVTGFVVFRGTIIRAESTVEWNGTDGQAEHCSRNTWVVLKNGRKWRWSYPSNDLLNGRFPFGEEVVVWRHSQSLPDGFRIHTASAWDSSVRQLCDGVEDERAAVRTAQTAYYRGGGGPTLGPNFDLWYTIRTLFEPDIAIQEFLPLKTIGAVASFISDRSGHERDEVWHKLRSTLIRDFVLLPKEITPNMSVSFAMSTDPPTGAVDCIGLT